jgi:hypothetical protein
MRGASIRIITVPVLHGDTNMSKRLRRYANQLKEYYKASNKKRKNLLRSHLKDREFINCVCECSKNILRSRVKLSGKQRRALQKKKNALRLLSQKNVSLNRKKKIIQSGGFLPLLISPLLSIIGELFGGS